MVFSAGPTPRLYNEKFQESSKLSEAERVQLKKSSFELVFVKNWVDFWRRKSKVTDKKWQERT
jgi:hypothetical protein